MRRIVVLAAGVFIGQWLAFAGLPSPGDFYRQGLAAWERSDYADALRLWSEGLSAQPDNVLLHYRRATALARLGQRNSALDAYRLTLLLEPPAPIAHLVRQELSRLEGETAAVAAADTADADTVVTVEPARGVWIVAVLLEGHRQARFLVDSGSSVTIVAPALARDLRLPPGSGTPIELQTIGGQTTAGPSMLRVLRLGGAELRDVPVVIHDPGPGLDGILGNTVLGRYRMTLDPDRRLLQLQRSARD